MALILDQHPNLKHFCKICRKGFGCGRALGGHMRAHGIGDESTQIDDEEQGSDWEDKLRGNNSNNVPPTNKRMYALRTNPNRLKACRVCENCGKEFLSWKSFLEHGKCISEDVESLVSSPDFEGEDGIMARRGCGGWSKRKRSLTAKVENFNSNCPSSEEEDLANCLMMLSNAAVDLEPEESCASASKEQNQRNTTGHFKAPISCQVHNIPVDNRAKSIVTKGLFECKACKKVFNSHQALGGHRASHKKVKGCFAARPRNLEDSLVDDDVITHEEFFPTKSNSTMQLDYHMSNSTLASSSKKKSKVHECSICHRVFSSGQALGGHKRCHWIIANAPDTSTLATFHPFHDHIEHMNQTPKFDNLEALDLKLDLNFPAPPNDLTQREVSTKIYLQSWLGSMKDKENDKCYNHLHRRHGDIVIDKDNNAIDNNESSMCNVDDEADSKMKLAKLSELKDMNKGGSSSPWLQVGIGSTTEVRNDS